MHGNLFTSGPISEAEERAKASDAMPNIFLQKLISRYQVFRSQQALGFGCHEPGDATPCHWKASAAFNGKADCMMQHFHELLRNALLDGFEVVSMRRVIHRAYLTSALGLPYYFHCQSDGRSHQ